MVVKPYLRLKPTCISFDTIQPLWYVVESICIGDVICHYHSICTTVVTLGDGPEALLSCCVPYLKLQ